MNDTNTRPPVAGVRSIRTLFIGAMLLLAALLSAPLLYSATTLMDQLVERYAMELLHGELQARLAPVDRQYQTLYRVGLEDSQEHRQEILRTALASFASFRYKRTGRLFVVHREGRPLLPAGIPAKDSPAFPAFFAKLQAGDSPIEYRAADRTMRAVFRYYEPWQSFVGLSMDKEELFFHHGIFARINLAILLAGLAIAGVFTWLLQRYIILPLIGLAHFVGAVERGERPSPPAGVFLLELGRLRDGVLQMVQALQAKMAESRRQLEQIREREEELSQTLDQLQEREERYRTVFNAPSDAIFLHDPKSGAIVEANRGAERMYGYSGADLRTKQIGDLSLGNAPYGQEEAVAHVRRALEKGGDRFEWYARRAEGSLFWVEVALHAVSFGGQRYILGVVRDIDARKRAEMALAKEKEQLAITLRSIGDGVITTDDRGLVVIMNPVAEALTGWRENEALGRPLTEVFTIVHETTGAPIEDPAAKVLRTGRLVELGNHVILVSRQGDRRAIADSAAPIHDPQQRLAGVVLVFRDMTEKYRTERELRKIQKLESIGVLAGGIAHDFNNILTTILGNVSLALAHLEQPGRHGAQDELPLLLKQAERATEQASKLARQLLTFAKGGDPVLQTASIADIITEATGFVLRGSSVRCEFDFAADLWPVRVDPGQISQVIQNIVLNARQVMSEGGAIAISAANHLEPPAGGEAGREEQDEKRWVRIAISDTGPGMPADVLDKIFDPYFTQREGGTGLGLAICHSIVTRHDGRLTVVSEPGQGSTFTILLPASPEDTRTTADEDEGAAAGRPLRVLVMDDDPMIRQLACRMLEFLGHRATAVADGEAAIAAYQEALANDSPFEVVIMDLTIVGGMGGIEAAAALRRLAPSAKLVVASGYANDPVLAEHQRYGFCAAMAKPYTTQALRRLLAQLCG